MTHTLLAVFGTRPEAIKMAPVINCLQKKYGAGIKTCVTAQHRQMLDQCLQLFNLNVDYDLNLMQPNQDLTTLSCRILQRVGEIIRELKPDCILVQGDTTTAAMGALAAFYHKVPVAHVEAGLRSHNIHAPWPEEGNRKLIANFTDIHFAPTVSAANHLINEGVLQDNIYVTGNTVIDALLETKALLLNNRALSQQFDEMFNFLDPEKKLILVTGHRRENFGEGFQQICQALAALGERDDVQIVYPVHLNPNVQTPVRQYLSQSPHIYLLEPLDYLPFVYLMMKSHLILTDSGGIQEEAPALGKPVLVLREVTERPEGIAAGTAKLAGVDAQQIISQTAQLLDDPALYQQMSSAHNPYGDGCAASRILQVLETRFSNLCSK